MIADAMFCCRSHTTLITSVPVTSECDLPAKRSSAIVQICVSGLRTFPSRLFCRRQDSSQRTDYKGSQKAAAAGVLSRHNQCCFSVPFTPYTICWSILKFLLQQYCFFVESNTFCTQRVSCDIWHVGLNCELPYQVWQHVDVIQCQWCVCSQRGRSSF